jgi:hypothetical protein
MGAMQVSLLDYAGVLPATADPFDLLDAGVRNSLRRTIGIFWPFRLKSVRENVK